MNGVRGGAKVGLAALQRSLSTSSTQACRIPSSKSLVPLAKPPPPVCSSKPAQPLLLPGGPEALLLESGLKPANSSAFSARFQAMKNSPILKTGISGAKAGIAKSLAVKLTLAVFAAIHAVGLKHPDLKQKMQDKYGAGLESSLDSVSSNKEHYESLLNDHIEGNVVLPKKDEAGIKIIIELYKGIESALSSTKQFIEFSGESDGGDAAVVAKGAVGSLSGGVRKAALNLATNTSKGFVGKEIKRTSSEGAEQLAQQADSKLPGDEMKPNQYQKALDEALDTPPAEVTAGVLTKGATAIATGASFSNAAKIVKSSPVEVMTEAAVGSVFDRGVDELPAELKAKLSDTVGEAILEGLTTGIEADPAREVSSDQLDMRSGKNDTA